MCHKILHATPCLHSTDDVTLAVARTGPHPKRLQMHGQDPGVLQAPGTHEGSTGHQCPRDPLVSRSIKRNPS
jgi:hypothetical protein